MSLKSKNIVNIEYAYYNKMIPGSNDHVFHACMKKHDFETRKT